MHWERHNCLSPWVDDAITRKNIAVVEPLRKKIEGTDGGLLQDPMHGTIQLPMDAGADGR